MQVDFCRVFQNQAAEFEAGLAGQPEVLEMWEVAKPQVWPDFRFGCTWGISSMRDDYPQILIEAVQRSDRQYPDELIQAVSELFAPSRL